MLRSFQTLALALCAAALLACGDPQPTAQSPDGAAPEAQEERALLDALERAHATLHAAPAPAPDALLQAVQREGNFRAPLEAFYKEAPPCALRCGGDLSAAGRALLRWLEEAPQHGVPLERFEVKALREDLEAWRSATGASALLPDPAAESPQAAALEILRAPQFSRAKARALLAPHKGSLPAEAEVERLRAALAAQPAPSGEEAARRARQELRVEVLLGRALLQAVMEMGLVRRAGPDEVTQDDERHAEAVQAALVPQMLGVARADDPAAALAALWPDEPEYQQMLAQHRRYLALAERGCPALTEGAALAKGASGPAVRQLQERLQCEGYLEGALDDQFDARVEEAVQRYQRHHDMQERGEIGEGDLRSLNVPMRRRARQIGLALQRMRDERLKDMGAFFVLINLPAFQMRIYEDGAVVQRRKVIIGSNKLDDDKYELIQGHINRTPLLQTRLYEIVVNPDWLLPPRVSKGELLGHLEKNPNYLEENNIRKVALANGKEGYAQGVGKGNVLGKVKFLLEKSSAIYLHDTNDKTLFKKRTRAFSHGCVRVDGATELAQWLLVRDGHDKREMERALEAQKVQRGIKLNSPIPLAMVYRTVELGESGLPVFYSDIYKYDEAYFEGKLPVGSTARWGDDVLRPHWVPKVAYNEYKAWKDAGQPAPRDLKPEGAPAEDATEEGKPEKGKPAEPTPGKAEKGKPVEPPPKGKPEKGEAVEADKTANKAAPGKGADKGAAGKATPKDEKKPIKNK